MKTMLPGFDRRELFRRAAWAAGALAARPLGALAAPAAALPPASRPQKVIVVGAGLAGLAAAWELQQAGHEATVLEARTRPGGRVLTLRDPFADGLYAEAGATQVFDNHHWTRHYAGLLGLSLDPVETSGQASITCIRGHRIRVEPGVRTDWPLDLTPEERELDRQGMWQTYVATALEEIGDPAAPGWPPDSAGTYDAVTFTDFLRARGASPYAVALLRLGFPDLSGEGADRLSALYVLREALHRQTMRQVFTLRGGSDRLPRAFAAGLEGRIRYGAPVVRIEHDSRGVRAVSLEAGVHHTLAADRLVCAVPFSVLNRIEISPGLSPEKRAAIEQLAYTSVSRVFVQTRERFWTRDGLTGNAATDLPVMGVYHKTMNQPGPRGILESYTAGPRARQVAAMDDGERLAATLDGMEKVYPGIREHAEGGSAKCWDEDEWARGAYTWLAPGQLGAGSPLRQAGRAEGRIHFAGEHASSAPGWMQGALEAGNRVAREIHGSATVPGQG